MSYKDLELYKMLKRLFSSPILILVKGDWRSGKTDTSLLVGYLAMKWGLISRLGSNIFTFNNPKVDYIVTTGHLKKWGHADKTTKLFILDEGLKWLYRRKAMSSLNVDFVSEILPEVSKAHLRLILITQIDKIDSDVLDPAFCRAVWKKLSKKVMECRAKNYPFRRFTHLPPSPIKFDADRLAQFFNKEIAKNGEFKDLARIQQISKLYASGTSLNEIAGKLDMHREQVKREIRKALKWFVGNYSPPEDPEAIKKVNPEI